MMPGRNAPCPCGSGKKYKACCGRADGQGKAVDTQALLQLFNGGRFAILELQLEQLLVQQPRHAFLHGLLGATRQMLGLDGLPELRLAASLAPNDAEAHCNLGAALFARGEAEAAADSFRRALAGNAKLLRAAMGLGNVLASRGRPAEAEAAFRQALRIDPGNAGASIALGEMLSRLKRPDEAEKILRRVLVGPPGPALAEAQLGLGNLQRQLGRLDEAEASYRAALVIDPHFARAHNNLGSHLLACGRSEEAEAAFRAALRADSGYADAWANLGAVSLRAQRLDEAEGCYREALARQPGRAEFLAQHAFVLHELGRNEDALALYRHWAAQDAQAALPRLGLAVAELPIAVNTVEEAVGVVPRFGRALDELERWLDAAPEHLAAWRETIGSLQPFQLAYRDGNPLPLLRRYGDLIARGVQPAGPPPPSSDRTRLRLTIVSNQVRRHSVWEILLHGLLAHIDRTRFEIILYHLGSVEDEETVAARQYVDRWHGLRDFADFPHLLRAVAAEAPDAIFYPEIGMDPFTLRLAAHRLAPLQLTSWGHPLSSGLPSLDLFLSGELLEGEGAAEHYRETLVRLPGTGCCTAALNIAAEAVDDVAAELARRPGPRFIVAQRAFKADPAHDELFARIAERTGACSLILLRDPAYPWASAMLRQRLERAFHERGLDAARFLVELPWQSPGRFLGLLELCDVFLDCPAFSGYTTAWQAAHVGVPIVTLAGEFLRQRLAAGLLRRIGLPGTIAHSADEYVAFAADLAREAGDPAQRAARRVALRRAAPQADDDLAVVRAFEATLVAEVARRSASAGAHR